MAVRTGPPGRRAGAPARGTGRRRQDGSLVRGRGRPGAEILLGVRPRCRRGTSERPSATAAWPTCCSDARSRRATRTWCQPGPCMPSAQGSWRTRSSSPRTSRIAAMTGVGRPAPDGPCTSSSRCLRTPRTLDGAAARARGRRPRAARAVRPLRPRVPPARAVGTVTGDPGRRVGARADGGHRVSGVSGSGGRSAWTIRDAVVPADAGPYPVSPAAPGPRGAAADLRHRSLARELVRSHCWHGCRRRPSVDRSTVAA